MQNLHTSNRNTLTLKYSVNFCLNFLFLFQSQCASSGATAAIFRQFAGCVLLFINKRHQPLNGSYLGGVLLQFIELELYWGAVFFVTRRRALERSFKIFLLDLMLKKELKHVKIFGVVWVMNKIEEWSGKRVVFFSYRCFRESQKLRCEKFL